MTDVENVCPRTGHDGPWITLRLASGRACWGIAGLVGCGPIIWPKCISVPYGRAESIGHLKRLERGLGLYSCQDGLYFRDRSIPGGSKVVLEVREAGVEPGEPGESMPNLAREPGRHDLGARVRTRLAGARTACRRLVIASHL